MPLTLAPVPNITSYSFDARVVPDPTLPNPANTDQWVDITINPGGIAKRLTPVYLKSNIFTVDGLAPGTAYAVGWVHRNINVDTGAETTVSSGSIAVTTAPSAGAGSGIPSADGFNRAGLTDILKGSAVKRSSKLRRHKILCGKRPWRTEADLPHAVRPDDDTPYADDYYGTPLPFIESYSIHTADNLAADQLTLNGSSGTDGEFANLFDYMDVITVDELYTGVGSSKSSGWIRKATGILDDSRTTAARGDRSLSQSARNACKLLTMNPFEGKLWADRIREGGSGGARVEMTCVNPTPPDDEPYYKFVHIPNPITEPGRRTIMWADKPSVRLWTKDGEHAIPTRDGSVQVVYGDGEVLIEREYFRTHRDEGGLGDPKKAGKPWITIQYARWALESDELFRVVERIAPHKEADDPAQFSVPGDVIFIPRVMANDPLSWRWRGCHVWVAKGAKIGALGRTWLIREVSIIGGGYYALRVEADRDGMLPKDVLTAGSDVICINDCNRVERRVLQVAMDAGFQPWKPFNPADMSGLFYIKKLAQPFVEMRQGAYELNRSSYSYAGAPYPGAKRVAGKTTYWTATSNTVKAGDQVTVSGCGTAAQGFNGTFNVEQVLTRSEIEGPNTVTRQYGFTVTQAGPDAVAGNGAVEVLGGTVRRGVFLPSTSEFDIKGEDGLTHQEVLDRIKKYLPSNYRIWADENSCLWADQTRMEQSGYVISNPEKAEVVRSDTELKTAVRYRVRSPELVNLATLRHIEKVTFNRDKIHGWLGILVGRNSGGYGSLFTDYREGDWSLVQTMFGHRENNGKMVSFYGWADDHNLDPDSEATYDLWESQVWKSMFDGKTDTEVGWGFYHETSGTADAIELFRVEFDDEYELSQINMRGGKWSLSPDGNQRTAVEVSLDGEFWDEIVPDAEMTSQNKSLVILTDKDFGAKQRFRFMRFVAANWCSYKGTFHGGADGSLDGSNFKGYQIGANFKSVQVWPINFVVGKAILGETPGFTEAGHKHLAERLNLGGYRWYTVPAVDEMGYHMAQLVFPDELTVAQKEQAYADARAAEYLNEMSKDFSPLQIAGVRPDLRVGDTVHVDIPALGFDPGTPFMVRELTHSSEGTVDAKAYPYYDIKWIYSGGTKPPEAPQQPVLVFTDEPDTVKALISGPTPIGQVQATVRAPDGSALTGYTGLVTATLVGGDAGAALSGTTAAFAVAGVATFANLAISQPGANYRLVLAAAGVSWDGQSWSVASTSRAFAVYTDTPESVYFQIAPGRQTQPDPPESPDRTVFLSQPVLVVVPRNERAAADYTNVSATLSLLEKPDGAALYGAVTAAGTTVDGGFTGEVAWSGLSVDKPGVYRLQASVSLQLDGDAVVETCTSDPFTILARTGTLPPDPGGANVVRSDISFPLTVTPKSTIPAPPASGNYREDFSPMLDGSRSSFTFPTRVSPRDKGAMTVILNIVTLPPNTYSLSGNVLTIDWSLANFGSAGNYLAGGGDLLFVEFPYHIRPA